MSILFLVNKYTNKHIDTMVINDNYHLFVDIGWMRRDCYIVHPVEIARHMGWQIQDLRHESAEYQCKPEEYEILKYRSSYPHFVVGDGEGHVAYDPYGVSKAVTTGQLVGKRIFA